MEATDVVGAAEKGLHVERHLVFAIDVAEIGLCAQGDDTFLVTKRDISLEDALDTAEGVAIEVVVHVEVTRYEVHAAVGIVLAVAIVHLDKGTEMQEIGLLLNAGRLARSVDGVGRSEDAAGTGPDVDEMKPAGEADGKMSRMEASA